MRWTASSLLLLALLAGCADPVPAGPGLVAVTAGPLAILAVGESVAWVEAETPGILHEQAGEVVRQHGFGLDITQVIHTPGGLVVGLASGAVFRGSLADGFLEARQLRGLTVDGADETLLVAHFRTGNATHWTFHDPATLTGLRTVSSPTVHLAGLVAVSVGQEVTGILQGEPGSSHPARLVRFLRSGGEVLLQEIAGLDVVPSAFGYDGGGLVLRAGGMVSYGWLGDGRREIRGDPRVEAAAVHDGQVAMLLRGEGPAGRVLVAALGHDCWTDPMDVGAAFGDVWFQGGQAVVFAVAEDGRDRIVRVPLGRSCS